MPDGFFLMPEAAICKVAVPSSLAYYIRSGLCKDCCAITGEKKKKGWDGRSRLSYEILKQLQSSTAAKQNAIRRGKGVSDISPRLAPS